MKLMLGSSHVHGRGLPRRGDRSQVGIDVVLPQSQPAEDVRGHVQRVWGGRRNLRVTARGRQTGRGKLRRVVRVNQIVRDARMVGLRRKQRLQDCRRFFPLLD